MSDQVRQHPSIMDGVETVEVDTLRPFYMNARHGDHVKLRASLAKTGQYKRLTVNRGTKTGRPREILAGNNTWACATDLGWPTIDIEWVDVDDQEANRINIVDNRLNDLATYDTDVQAEQLSMLDDDYEGSGWTEDEVEKFLTPPDMDEPEEPDSDEQMGGYEYRVVVDCKDEKDQARLIETLEKEGRTCRPLSV